MQGPIKEHLLVKLAPLKYDLILWLLGNLEKEKSAESSVAVCVTLSSVVNID